MPRPPQKSGRPGLSMAGQTNKRPVLNLPRQAAVRILNGVMTEHKQLSELTQSDDFQALAPEDRARSSVWPPIPSAMWAGRIGLCGRIWPSCQLSKC